VKGTVLGGGLEEMPISYDFRRPDRFPRDSVRTLSVAHEVFARRLASGLGSALRSLVQLEPVSVDQLTFDDYVRSMPNPTVAALLALPPLPGTVVVEIDVRLALLLVDRMLGGGSSVGGAGLGLRRPTELETFLLGDLVRHAGEALREALAGLADPTPELLTVEYNPQLVQVAPPSDTVLLFTYRLSASQGLETEGLLTLCYPSATVQPLLDRIEAQSGVDHSPALADLASSPLLDQVAEVDVTLTARLRESTIAAADVAALRPGDVLRLDHRVSEPVLVEVGGVPVVEGHLGRRGRRLAVQVLSWLPRSSSSPFA